MTKFKDMLDKNGKQLKVGHVVKIEGGFFKSDNGLFIVAHAPNDPNWSGSDCSLRKCSKKFIESKSKYATAFFPLFITVNDSEKRATAREHNKKATIEIVGKVPAYKIKYFVYDREYTKIILDRELKEMEENKDRFPFEIIEVL